MTTKKQAEARGRCFLMLPGFVLVLAGTNWVFVTGCFASAAGIWLGPLFSRTMARKIKMFRIDEP